MEVRVGVGVGRDMSRQPELFSAPYCNLVIIIRKELKFFSKIGSVHYVGNSNSQNPSPFHNSSGNCITILLHPWNLIRDSPRVLGLH